MLTSNHVFKSESRYSKCRGVYSESARRQLASAMVPSGSGYTSQTLFPRRSASGLAIRISAAWFTYVTRNSWSKSQDSVPYALESFHRTFGVAYGLPRDRLEPVKQESGGNHRSPK